MLTRSCFRGFLTALKLLHSNQVVTPGVEHLKMVIGNGDLDTEQWILEVVCQCEINSLAVARLIAFA